LPIAEAISTRIPVDLAIVQLWTHDVFGPSRFPIEDLEAQLDRADFAVLVLRPDDRVESRGKEHDAPRDNVVFELGLFMALVHIDGSFWRHLVVLTSRFRPTCLA